MAATTLCGCLAMLVLWVSPLGAQALLPFVISRATALHNAPQSPSIIAQLPAGSEVLVSESSAPGLFAQVRTRAGQVGWVDATLLFPRELMIPRARAITADALTAAAEKGFPKCGTEKHYRWDAKVHATLHTSLAAVTIATILTKWTKPPFVVGKSLAAWCVDRSPPENVTHSVTGFLSRIKRGEADRDWHIELTQTAKGPVGRCIVAEIPDPSFDKRFTKSRNDLLARIASAGAHTDSHGDISPRVRITIIGSAFYDGWHSKADGTPDGAHGRCNSNARALWEIHPIFKVQ